MKITIEHSALIKALGTVQAIVAGQTRTSVQILSHVMIEAADNICTLTTTDLEMQVKNSLPAIVTEAGRITVPVQLLFGITRALPEGAQVDLALGEDGQLTLKAGKSRFALHTLPADEFPDLAAGAFPHEFALPAAALRNLIEKTRFAISTDEGRYYLNGIYFHQPKKPKDVLRAVATDGYRLALCDVKLPEGADALPGVIVPRKTVAELHRFIENSEEPVTINLSKTMICYSCEGMTLTSKIIDGSFPDYARIIPEQNEKVLTIANKDFTFALRRVNAVFVDSPPMSTPLIKLALDKKKLSLSGVCSGRGSAHEDIDIDYESEAIEIGFNPDFLLDITERIGEKVRVEMASPDVAAILRDAAPQESQNENSGNTLYVLMPMRV